MFLRVHCRYVSINVKTVSLKCANNTANVIKDLETQERL